MMLSARLRASQRLRETALASVANDPAGMSAVLLSELATLMAATMRRVELKGFGERNDIIGAAALRGWWSAYCDVLIPEHMEEARAALVACGVSDAAEVER